MVAGELIMILVMLPQIRCRVGSFSPSRRRPPPGLQGVDEDVATDDLAEGEVRPPRLGRDSMGSDAGDTNGGLAA